jgi:hypothetical protein
MTLLRRWTNRVGILTVLVAILLGSAVSPARADDYPPAYATVDAFAVDGAVATDPAGTGATVFGPPSIRGCEYGCEGAKFCRSLYLVYKIYTFYADLVRWRQKYTWCWQNEMVVQASHSQNLEFISPSMRMSGSVESSLDPVPADVVRSVFEGLRFDYCPAFVSCLLAFHPRLDVYLLLNRNWLDLSRLY